MKKIQNYKEITEKELWVFFGIMTTAGIVGKRGDMWDWKKPEGVRLSVNVNQYMKK